MIRYVLVLTMLGCGQVTAIDSATSGADDSGEMRLPVHGDSSVDGGRTTETPILDAGSTFEVHGIDVLGDSNRPGVDTAPESPSINPVDALPVCPAAIKAFDCPQPKCDCQDR